MTLSSPVELLELQDKESVTFTPVRIEQGSGTIVPAHAPQGKDVEILRVHVSPGDKPHFPHYFDITAKRLRAQLEPFLLNPNTAKRKYRITAFGVPPRKYFTVEVL